MTPEPVAFKPPPPPLPLIITLYRLLAIIPTDYNRKKNHKHHHRNRTLDIMRHTVDGKRQYTSGMRRNASNMRKESCASERKRTWIRLSTAVGNDINRSKSERDRCVKNVQSFHPSLLAFIWGEGKDSPESEGVVATVGARSSNRTGVAGSGHSAQGTCPFY